MPTDTHRSAARLTARREGPEEPRVSVRWAAAKITLSTILPVCQQRISASSEGLGGGALGSSSASAPATAFPFPLPFPFPGLTGIPSLSFCLANSASCCRNSDGTRGAVTVSPEAEGSIPSTALEDLTVIPSISCAGVRGTGGGGGAATSTTVLPSPAAAAASASFSFLVLRFFAGFGLRSFTSGGPGAPGGALGSASAGAGVVAGAGLLRLFFGAAFLSAGALALALGLLGLGLFGSSMGAMLPCCDWCCRYCSCE
mmetsp:Transcript_5349/g.11687  ORF Transcript_5349/g.11687 Transcript_5349/m.11687 type:complete len:257 (+) Transcript_5349:364-1134(+)